MASPSRSFSLHVRLDGGRLALEPVQLRLGGLSVRSRIVGATRDTPAEGIAEPRRPCRGCPQFLPPASRDRLSAEGPLKVDLSIRGGADLASISGDAFAQLTYPEEKAPERAGRGRRARGLSGEIRLALDLRATAFDPNAVDGTIVATTLAISAGQFPIAQQAPTRLRLEKGRIHIEQFDWKLPSGALAASGTIGLGPPNHSDMRVSGATSLGLADVFLPGRGAGRAAFDIRIAGPIDSPQYEGTIELTDAASSCRRDESHSRDGPVGWRSPETPSQLQRFAARSMVATSRSTGRSLDAEPRRHHR